MHHHLITYSEGTVSRCKDNFEARKRVSAGHFHHISAMRTRAVYRPRRMTPAAMSFWIFVRTWTFFMCSCRAAGSLLACWRMLCMTGSWRIDMIWSQHVRTNAKINEKGRSDLPRGRSGFSPWSAPPSRQHER